jgi:3-hydroxybutyryl-CoA dehydrogenase
MSAAMETKSVGVAGLGMLGRGIAACLLSRGFRVIGYTRDANGFSAAREYIAHAVDDLVTRAGFPASLRGQWVERYRETATLADFEACDFVIESVFEDAEVKGSVFNTIEAVVGPAVSIASNTSGLPITHLQRGRKHPERFIGMHWAEPCHLTRFLEVIRGEKTDDATVDATIALARAAGKEPSLVRMDVPGFIVNRIGYAMFREALHLLESGVADAETIDRSFRNAVGLWASIAGPFRWMDLTGLPAYAAVMSRLFRQLSNSTDVPNAMRMLVESGATGVANGRGFYKYTPEEAEQWEELLVDHVWNVRAMTGRYFPESGVEESA